VSEHRSLPVPDGLDGDRLDSALARLLGVSRSRAADLVEAGAVRVDGAPVAKSARVRAGAWLEVTLPAVRAEGASASASTAAPTSGQAASAVDGLRVVHSDDDLVVVDKPVGVAAHPSPGWAGPTVLGHLAASGVMVAASGAAERQGIVHRLDVGTSGLMVVARSERGYSTLKQAFRDRAVDKTYHALVQGQLDPLRGTIDAPIARHPRHDHRWAVVASGKEAITHYDTLEAHRWASLVEVRLETGRTHQIRVHMGAVRHPCVGDLTYGADPVLARRLEMTRQWLHATRLGFDHPATGRRVGFDSTYPGDLQRALERIRSGG